MTRTDHIRLMASYNTWMNAKLYDAAKTLPGSALEEDRGAFFGSILGTLNHLAVADRIWLGRFATHPARYVALEPVRSLPAPISLSEMLCQDFRALAEHRVWIDELINQWAASIAEQDLDQILHYKNTKGIAANRPFFGLLMHFFNHQTHHRGQVTTLLSQAGVDVGITDLLALVSGE